MKNKIGFERIKELAQDLECGFKLYINTDSLETKTILSSYDSFGLEDNIWDDEMKQIEDNWKNYEIIEPPSSRDGFEIMESFLQKVSDPDIERDLSMALRLKSPFANFKAIVESSKARVDWFKHKSESYIEYLTRQLEWIDIEVEE